MSGLGGLTALSPNATLQFRPQGKNAFWESWSFDAATALHFTLLTNVHTQPQHPPSFPPSIRLLLFSRTRRCTIA